MNRPLKPKNGLLLTLLFTIPHFFLSHLQAQVLPTDASKAPVCKIVVNEKSYNLKPNTGGYFQRIAGIEKLAIVPIEIFYPDAKAGEKVVLSVLDGGALDNGQMVKMVSLDAQKKCSFKFQVTDQLGLFRISLYKGEDTKTMQLWVGPEPAPAKQ